LSSFGEHIIADRETVSSIEYIVYSEEKNILEDKG